jgi:hypothetical protein
MTSDEVYKLIEANGLTLHGDIEHFAALVKERTWVGLSEEEIDKLKHLIDWTATWSHGRFAYEIEQLLKEKNA